MLLDGEDLDPDEFRIAWERRQRFLATLVDSLAPPEREVRVDLARGTFAWVDRVRGEPAVVATARVIASWGEASQSLLMGWANDGLPAGRALAPAGPLSSVRDRHGLDMKEAFWVCIGAATEAGAHFVYRLPTEKGALFFALWRVRVAAEDGPDPAVGFWTGARGVVARLTATRRDERDGTLPPGAFQLDELALHVSNEIGRGEGLEDERQWLAEEISLLQDYPDEVDDRLEQLTAEIERGLSEAGSPSRTDREGSSA